eukprot:gene1117-1671_t
MPYNYDNKSKTYQVYGNFCTWNCMKAFNINETDYQKNNRSSLITMMYYHTHNKTDVIKIAPPRQKLKIFGGDMDINEFRSCDDEYSFTMPPLINIQHNIDKNHNNNYKFINNDEADKNFKNVSKIKINPIKIKNSKNDNSSLHSVLGIMCNSSQ